MIQIPYYETSYFVFSNFSAHQITFNGVKYATLEHGFHAQKFENKDILDEIMMATSPLGVFNK